MLTKRTNILFDQETWDYLVGLAAKRETSVGDIVRKAVIKEHLNQKDQRDTDREKAHEMVLELRKNMSYTFTTKEILNYVHDGRKYE